MHLGEPKVLNDHPCHRKSIWLEDQEDVSPHAGAFSVLDLWRS